MTAKIAYVVGGDNWVPCYISLYSVLKNNKKTQFTVYILTEETKNNSFFNNIAKLEDVHNSFEIKYIKINTSEFINLPSPGRHLHIGVYYKLDIDKLLPTKENILLLDTDTICDGSLDKLFKTDISEYVLATPASPHSDIVELDLPPHKPKFNAGVLFININNYDNNNIRAKARDYIVKNEPELNDQSALNHILLNMDQVKYISPKYNATRGWSHQFLDKDEDPVIIHYTNHDKPWKYATQRPYKDLWWEYYESSPFENYQPPDRSWKNFVRKYATKYKHTFSAHLEKYPRVYRFVKKYYDMIA